MTSTARAARTAGDLLAAAIATCDRLGRTDLADRLRAAAARLANPTTVIAVVGEFKQGKSQLVNALVGRDLCPVDDDLATVAVTWIFHRAEPRSRVRRVKDGEYDTMEVPFDHLDEYIAEAGNPDNRKQVDLVEIGLPNPVLSRGITLVDTPGAGALRAGAAEAVLGFLPYADALLFVTDASAPLSPAELRFLARARERCPAVVVVLSKVDLYPEWRRIRAIDEERLREAGLPDGIVAVSAELRRSAIAIPDAKLNDESGVPDLMAHLRVGTLEGAEREGAGRALAEAGDALEQLRVAARARREALADPERGRVLLEQFETAKARLDDLHKARSRWTTALADGIGDLNQESDYRLKSFIQRAQDHIEHRLSDTDPAREWEALAAEVQADMATAVQEIFDNIDEHLRGLAESIAELLEDEKGFEAPTVESQEETTAESLWAGLDRVSESRRAAVLSSALSALRGTSSGVMLLGVMARLAGLALATPISIGVGVAFGAKQVVDERKRSLEKRRHEARAALRGFLNKAQIELGTRIRQVIRDGHRALRDSFSHRIGELTATVTSGAAGIRTELDQHEADRRQILPVLDDSIATLGDLIGEVRTALDRHEGSAR